MDEPSSPDAAGCRLTVTAAGEAWSWRLTAPDGATLRGIAPDPASARRSAAFAAQVVTALTRARRRRV